MWLLRTDIMPDAKSNLLDTLAGHAALEVLTIESGPAFFEPTKGERTVGFATVTVSRASIAIHFTPDASMTVAKAAYGEANGRIEALNGAWRAPKVNDVGLSAEGERLFVTQEVVVNQGASEKVAATRLVFAGTAWQGLELVDGRRVIAAPLSKEAVNHHDARMSITVEGTLDEKTTEAMERANSFVSGLDLELLRVDSFSPQGDLILARHLRGYRRVGRGPHCPFTGVADEHRMRAWAALATAIPRLEKNGIPIIQMINHIGSHNTVAEINSSSVLLLLATQTMAYHCMHGHEVGEGAASRRRELALLSAKLKLGLTEADLDRFEKLRVELLEAGFFHKPGYETGRPQKDIKFLRDIAHTTVFRLCGYSGPFYGAETFAVRDMPVGVS
jgi:hypothetical protein